jgi:hypothetical protein
MKIVMTREELERRIKEYATSGDNQDDVLTIIRVTNTPGIAAKVFVPLGNGDEVIPVEIQG